MCALRRLERVAPGTSRKPLATSLYASHVISSNLSCGGDPAARCLNAIDKGNGEYRGPEVEPRHPDRA